ncbi:hypothetical protein VTJ83DRAFT_7013 [Remersonia thermophila]|uniref:ASCH domain-containing protein n=1 Tax=Remersonia thermophila TaxID=72144 RepID=A0ABR4D2A1_9PEZI
MYEIDPSRPEIVAFMAAASAALGQTLTSPKDIFQFGDSPAIADELLLLAIQGKKTATMTWPVPDPLFWDIGDLSVILDGQGKPRALMRTTSMVRRRFCDVDQDFAAAEAEGDYETWRTGHIAYFQRQKEKEEFTEDSEVLCERFEVIYLADNCR